jgi:hypothetical protein
MLIAAFILLLWSTPSFSVTNSVWVAHYPNTTSHCTWWIDLKYPKACSEVLLENMISINKFRKWARSEVFLA